jgi:transposase
VISNDFTSIKNLLKKLGKKEQLKVCYEAGPCGYSLYRQIDFLGIKCSVIAPSLIPKKAGDKVKTDRRDAQMLARLFRAGELTEVWIPTEEDEALRDLVRAREDANQNLNRAKQRLLHFLGRNGKKKPPEIHSWSRNHRIWLRNIRFEEQAKQIAYEEYRNTIEEIEARIKRLEEEIHRQAEESSYSPVIKALQSLRGIREIAATTIVAEVTCFSRFNKPTQLMGYAGVVPREYSSGERVSRGGITKTGNTHVRRILIECAWSYRHQAAMTREIKKRQEGQSLKVQSIAWQAQLRLCGKYRRLVAKGKSGNIAITAVARELLGFIWAIACEVEQGQFQERRVA